MNIPHYSKIHNRFQLNGFHYTKEQLWEVAYSFIKEGAPNEQNLGVFILNWIDSSDQITLQTSGTTGPPKSIQVPKQAMVHSALLTAEYLNLPVGTTALNCLPIDFIAGKMMFIRALVLGWSLDLMDPVRNPLAHTDKNYDFSAFIPLQLENSIEELNRVKLLLVGGAPMGFKLRQKVAQISHCKIYETYGMTETLTHIALRRVDPTNPPFEVLPQVNIRTNADGCLVVLAPLLHPEEIETRDLVTLLDSSRFEWKGRKDFVINSGGIKIHPEAVERQLEPHLELPFFVSSLPDESLGEQLVLVVEGSPKDIEPIQKQLESIAFDAYHQPKQVVALETFVRTSSHKINRLETLKSLEILNL